ncbi:hypothetical protein K2173_009956 [Erythroxylum novogranatense]|uniref:Uncharacterized protein n=1 Tax=Erythroxylum novogranatense TaxID=1862640 RepID=A0AAV8T0S6_9ROSI|nr:hypothetical protein K2173_009956 [Erythroxylum novogranatense]
MTIVLRRSRSLCLKRAFAAFFNDPTQSYTVQSRKGSPVRSRPTSEIWNFGINRELHVKSGFLGFKSSVGIQDGSGQCAVDDYGYDDEKGLKRGGEEGLDISKLDISQEIVSALAKRGINKLFPIQKAVLEPAMQGRDLFGRARTGTGKTLAFGIPIMDKIIQFNAKHGRGRNPLALVMAPTRELARQVEKEFRESAPSLDSICLYGGTPITRQMRELDYGVDIVVGTPGRIIDLMKRGSLNLSEVQFVVLDEADQMLSVGFVDDVETILQRLPQNRHSMLFSATRPAWIRTLVRNYLKDPLTIDLVGDSDKKLPDGITIYSVASEMYEKASVLGPLISEHAKEGKCIVFTQTKRDADRLASAMARNYSCEALHGDISQAVRERTLSGFRNGNFNILIATDVAARGLDIPNVDLVIHYEIPNNPEIFVHRSGRTGRAGKKGTAILIYSQDQARQVRIFEREVGCRFTELPRIVGDGSINMFSDRGSSRFGSIRDRQSGGTGFGRFGGQADYGYGRSGSYRNPGFASAGGRGGQFSGRMNEYGRPGYNRNQPGYFGGSGSNRSGGFGELGGSDQSSAFGGYGSGRSSGFGEPNSSSRSSAFGGFNSGHSRGFGDINSIQDTDSPTSSSSSRFGRIGQASSEDNISTRRNS